MINSSLYTVHKRSKNTSIIISIQIVQYVNAYGLYNRFIGLHNKSGSLGSIIKKDDNIAVLERILFKIY